MLSGPSSSLRWRSRGAGAGEKGCSPRVTVLPAPLLLSAGAEKRSSLPSGKPSAGRGARESAEGGLVGQRLPPHPRTRSTHCAQVAAPCPLPAEGDLCSLSLGAEPRARSRKTRAWELQGVPRGSGSLPHASSLAGAWGAALHPESTRFVPGGLHPALRASCPHACPQASVPLRLSVLG